MNFIKKVDDIPIRLKFVSVYMIFILIPMVIIYGVFFTRISKEVRLREETELSQSLDRVHKDLMFLSEGCLYIARDIAIDRSLNALLDYTYPFSSDYYAAYYNTLRDSIQRYQSVFNNVVKVSVFTNNPTMDRGAFFYPLDQATNSLWFQEYKRYGKQSSFVGWVEENTLIQKKHNKQISLIRKMDEFNQYNTYEKYIKIDVNLVKIENILQKESLMTYLLVNQQGQILVTSDDAYLYNNSKQLSVFDKRIYDGKNKVFTKTITIIDNQNWNIIGIGSTSRLSKRIQNYGILIFGLCLLSFLLSIIMIYIFSNSYNRRIHMLQKHMKKVEHSDFSLIKQDGGKDEIGYLMRSFNKMTHRINDLVNKVLYFELREKEHQLASVKAELNYLQSQMDPHFLFNTLNAILVVCNRKNYTDITEIIKYLSKTLRRLLVWDDVMVPIEDEINFTEMYLKIEKFRFQDKFDYTIELEDAVKHYKIPKMTIQPFVENACKHGIQASKDNGQVLVRIYGLGEQIVMVIQDNGVGMPTEKVAELLQDNSQGNIGINNVYKRLKLNYQDAFHMKIESALQLGTTVMIHLPNPDQNRASSEIEGGVVNG